MKATSSPWPTRVIVYIWRISSGHGPTTHFVTRLSSIKPPRPHGSAGPPQLNFLRSTLSFPAISLKRWEGWENCTALTSGHAEEIKSPQRVFVHYVSRTPGREVHSAIVDSMLVACHRGSKFTVCGLLSHGAHSIHLSPPARFEVDVVDSTSPCLQRVRPRELGGCDMISARAAALRMSQVGQ